MQAQVRARGFSVNVRFTDKNVIEDNHIASLSCNINEDKTGWYGKSLTHTHIDTQTQTHTHTHMNTTGERLAHNTRSHSHTDVHKKLTGFPR